MIILGDIGNTDTKICLVNDDLKITKRFILSSKIKISQLNTHFKI